MKDLKGMQYLHSKLVIASLVSVFMLIVIGATVRVTGSGMGCPDWPKCFGHWVPPTSVSDLPANYQEIYKDRGYDSMAFNPTKTWIEYLNRLFGALTGFIAFFLAFTSLWLFKKDRTLVLMSFLIFLLIGFEGWLGAKVVESNLNQYKITTHLIAAMLILTCNLALILRYRKNDIKEISKPERNNSMSALLYSSLIILIAQILMGTMVRGEIDSISKNSDFRNEWTTLAITYFPIHRTFAIVVTLVSSMLIYSFLKRRHISKIYSNSAVILALSIAGQIATGMFLDRAGFPALSQLLHLAFAIVTFAVLVYSTMYYFKTTTKEVTSSREVRFA